MLVHSLNRNEFKEKRGIERESIRDEIGKVFGLRNPLLEK